MIFKIVSRFIIIGGILLFSQLPVFVDQYMLRLDGHLAESNRQVAAFQEGASIGGKTLEQYIKKFIDQSDPDFKNQGIIMQQTVERNRFLAIASAALHSANPLLRPALFVRYVDSQVCADAWKSFAPGLSWTKDVALWALIGLVVGWTVSMALFGLWQLLFRTAKPPSTGEKG